ncbi:PP2C family protein-serine/threonine phosphatase [Lignipirellula cremea]|uniref:Phosphoserine phosphatase RsbU n=1 Tax=Lignipirellula cremea TaxID=2528010 RepID=A0A518DPD5_9BACT|nr:SpoIIE family protein phosphatase [Lignipirellula cremea]QDU93673.1 Phosphoserine phosphatase RsbU [Lignipirellula cremea]
MTKQIPSYLRLHTEHNTESAPPTTAGYPGLTELCSAFAALSGWKLEETVVEQGCHFSPSIASDDPTRRLSLTAIEGREFDAAEPEAAEAMARAIGGLLTELQRTRQALWRREAELAAQAAKTPRSQEDSQLAQQLAFVLKGGAESVGCQAAALYLLDDDTSELKYRSGWNLPEERFLEPARPLRGAFAELEALVGHAVVLEDLRLLPHWNAPEDFASAVCVPVSTPSSPLGVMWVFGDTVRDYTDEQTNLLEIVAGRLAADLEREVLIDQGVKRRQVDRQINHAAVWQESHLPNSTLMLDDYEIAGWTRQAEDVGGDLHDWNLLPDGRLALLTGDAQAVGVEAALVAASLHAAVRSHANYRHSARQMAHRVNETLWTGAAGEQFASLFYGLLDPETHELEYAAAGHVAAFLKNGRSWRPLRCDGAVLGAEPQWRDKPRKFLMKQGDVLVVASEGACLGLLEADALNAHLPDLLPAGASAAEIVNLLRDELADLDLTDDQTLLVLRRKS